MYCPPPSLSSTHSLTHIWGPLVNPPSNLSLFIVMHATLSEWAGNRTGPATLWKVGGVRAKMAGGLHIFGIRYFISVSLATTYI
jgi:hypothetical protein